MLSTRHRLGRPVTLVVLAIAVLVGGCGSDDSADDPSSTDSTTAPGLSDAALVAYFEAVASYDPTLLAEARGSAQPGSNADHYAGYLQAFATAAIEGGSPIEASDVERVDGGFRACGGTGAPTSCVTWADIESAEDAVVDFTVDGQSLDERLVAGDGSLIEADDLATVEFLYSYKSPQSGTQFVAVLVSAEAAALRIDGDRATYRVPGGRGYPSAGAWGAASVDAGASATVVLPFEDAPTGGTASLLLFAEGDPAPAEVRIDTAP